ncbi:Pseudouridine synthase, RluA family [uncultured delta proteobacterium]|uniref:Dephospho-CoA kinase n=1 Tax=uncultured delta proteobacterium TaxID=34034 RepID=A0A212IWU0_9DELT|nr:Pseudouridine synthase, RluA family [uncultured delta proteobacterium]
MNPLVYKTPPLPGQAPGSDGSGPERRVFVVPETAGHARLDAFLGTALREEGVSREKIKQAILAGQVCCNGVMCNKPSIMVAPGDTVTAALPAPVTALTAEQGELAVLWHDEHLAVCNKPAGLTVHPAPGLTEGTLANLLLHHFPELAAQGGLRPGIVHRLDKDTSGLMLVALTETARLAMTEAFAARTVKKEYLALAYGVPAKAAGSITAPLGRSQTNKTKMAVVSQAKGGKEARSDYAVLYADPSKRFCLVRVAIHTGRTHQIRVHMQHIGHPLLGDGVYKTPNLPALPGPAPALEPGRQMLHAYTLAFTHPMTGEAMSFHAAPPRDFTALALSLAMPMQRVIITGSPGGGKSSLTRAVRDAGHPVWSADEAVLRLYGKGADGWHLLKARYGSRFVSEDTGDVDKKALFAAMTESDTFRREVEHMIHPLVFHDLELFWQDQELRGEALVAAEIPLALESGRYDPAQRAREGLSGNRREILAGIYTPFALRKQRMMDARGWSGETVARMESWQWPEEAKVRAVDLVVDNSGSLEDLQRRARNVLNVLAFLRSQTAKRLAAKFEALWGKS